MPPQNKKKNKHPLHLVYWLAARILKETKQYMLKPTLNEIRYLRYVLLFKDRWQLAQC